MIIPAVFDNTLITTVLSATLLCCPCWIVTALTQTNTLAYWVDSHFALLYTVKQEKKNEKKKQQQNHNKLKYRFLNYL